MDVETKLFSLKHTTALTDVRKEKKSVKTKKVRMSTETKEIKEEEEDRENETKEKEREKEAPRDKRRSVVRFVICFCGFLFLSLLFPLCWVVKADEALSLSLRPLHLSLS